MTVTDEIIGIVEPMLALSRGLSFCRKLLMMRFSLIRE